MSATGGAPARSHRAVGAVLVALAAVLAAFTGVVASVPTIHPAVVNDRLDLAIVTTSTLVAVAVAVAVAAIDWARGRVASDPAGLFRASAFTVLSVLRGFRPAQAPAGFGLDSMRQRATLIGAMLTVSSEPQNGTRIELELPNAKEGTGSDGG